MHVKEIKARVRDDAYIVHPQLVAEAMLRNAATRRAVVSPRDARGHAISDRGRRPSS